MKDKIGSRHPTLRYLALLLHSSECLMSLSEHNTYNRICLRMPVQAMAMANILGLNLIAKRGAGQLSVSSIPCEGREFLLIHF